MGRCESLQASCDSDNDPKEGHMQVLHATASFVGPGAMDDPFVAVIARQALEAATAEDRAELWFELGSEDSGEVSRLSIDLGYSDIEELLRLAPEDEILLEL